MDSRIAKSFHYYASLEFRKIRTRDVKNNYAEKVNLTEEDIEDLAIVDIT